ncbi:hypothetical protein EDD22DRAFT_853052 [Suillus occidentalis]|nr:hypothetical protein EDD22DRAFT_853052 [Suillus occidentalis]
MRTMIYDLCKGFKEVAMPLLYSHFIAHLHSADQTVELQVAFGFQVFCAYDSTMFNRCTADSDLAGSFTDKYAARALLIVIRSAVRYGTCWSYYIPLFRLNLEVNTGIKIVACNTLNILGGRNKTYRTLRLSLPRLGALTHGSNPESADLRFVDTLHNRYDLTMPPGAADGDSSTSFFNEMFQSNGYHPIYNPSAQPYPLPQYFPVFPPPIVSIDGTTTLAPGSEDILPLGEPPCFNEQLPLGDSFHIREPSLPPPPPQASSSGSRTRQLPVKEKALEFKFWPYPRARPKLRGIAQAASDATPTAPLRPSSIAPLRYDNEIGVHQKIFEGARTTLIQSTLNTCPFLTENEKKTTAHEALFSSANELDKEYGSQWSAENLSAFYKSFTVPPSAAIMSTCKKVARNVVQIGYSLQPSIWSEDPAPQYQIDAVKDLIDNPSFPLKFIFGNDLNDETDKLYPFEHRVILTVVLNTILVLGFVPYISDLDALFCTAAAAVECALQELASGELGKTIDFGVSNSKPRYTLFMEYIRDHIKTDSELSTRWMEYKGRVCSRLREIASYRHA